VLYPHVRRPDSRKVYSVRGLCLNLHVVILLALVLTGATPSPSRADWLNLTGAESAPNIAEIYVEKDHVRVQLEIFVQDLFVFEELVPEDFFSEEIPGRPDLEQRLLVFAKKGFQVVTDTGEHLPVLLTFVEPRMRVERPSLFAGRINPFTRRRVPGPPEDKRVLYAELIYPFTGQPRSLSFMPPSDDKGYPKASIGFLCYHLGVLVVDFRNLSAENLLHLDWEDPWYSAFEGSQLQRALQSGFRTFLYIEPFEVRHEILVRVRDMMPWLNFNLRGDENIEIDEFDAVRQQVAGYFMDRENVLIDGKPGKPILDRTAFVETSILGSRFIEIPEQVPINTAVIGIIVTYLTDGIPQEVSTRWDLFSDRIQKVTAVMTDPAGPFRYDLDPDDNILTWTNHLKSYTIPTVDKTMVDATYRGVPVPLGSLVCAVLLLPFVFSVVTRSRKSRSVRVPLAMLLFLSISAVVLFPHWRLTVGSKARASKMSEDDSRVMVHSLLKNVYRAFDFREEQDVYDKLAISVSGPLLRDIYLQNRKSMVIEQAGGAQAKVMEIEVLQATPLRSKERNGVLDVRTKWTALGSVGHWGHIHTRQNAYDAILTLAVQDGSWKISGIDLLEEKRVNPYVK
jgi:hypothetical protein